MKTKLAVPALALAAALAAAAPGRSEEKTAGQGVAAVDTAAHAKAVEDAVAAGRAALVRQQQADGHWGHDYPIAVTSMAGLALLAGGDAPLADPAVLKAFAWLDGRHTNGHWPKENYTWTHGQGFATLFFAELYGKVLTAREAPKGIAKDALRKTVGQAVTLLAEAQSASGGWNYDAGQGGDEGSTTVCAVQALRAAKNFGIPVEPRVLERGFAYLKAMQNRDGGFRYAGTQGGSMSSGSAAAVATLVLMQKLDEKVLFDALDFLAKRSVEGIATGGHGQYGLFYASMAMTVIAEEYGTQLPIASEWTLGIAKRLLREQQSGAWPSTEGDMHTSDYGTALSVLSLAAPRGRLSVFHRRGPKLP